LSHGFYAPLWLAGPTISFDDYLAQCAVPRVRKVHLGWYIFRLLGALAALEVGTQLYPCFALARCGLLASLGPRLGAAAVFITLNLMWLKFLMLWRVARAWALADGIDPPENMRRALCNHYSVIGFWKCWHASFNRWLVRYLYIPVGGKNRRALAAAVTFGFVAVWHDIEIKLLAWGGFNAIFVALESVALGVWRKHGKGLATSRPWIHRQLSAFGGAAFVFILMAGNMIGYSVGVSGVSSLLATAAETWSEGLIILIGGFAVFFSGTQVMFEVRYLDGTYASSVERRTRNE